MCSRFLAEFPFGRAVVRRRRGAQFVAKTSRAPIASTISISSCRVNATPRSARKVAVAAMSATAMRVAASPCPSAPGAPAPNRREKASGVRHSIDATENPPAIGFGGASTKPAQKFHDFAGRLMRDHDARYRRGAVRMHLRLAAPEILRKMLLADEKSRLRQRRAAREGEREGDIDAGAVRPLRPAGEVEALEIAEALGREGAPVGLGVAGAQDQHRQPFAPRQELRHEPCEREDFERPTPAPRIPRPGRSVRGTPRRTGRYDFRCPRDGDCAPRPESRAAGRVLPARRDRGWVSRHDRWRGAFAILFSRRCGHRPLHPIRWRLSRVANLADDLIPRKCLQLPSDYTQWLWSSGSSDLSIHCEFFQSSGGFRLSLTASHIRMRRPQMDLVAFVDFPPEAMLIERVRFNFHSEVWVFSRSKMWVFRHVRIMPRSGPQRHGKKISARRGMRRSVHCKYGRRHRRVPHGALYS